MKECIVTTSWDDGHVLDMRLAPLLKKYGVKGTFYISPEDKEFSSVNRLSTEELREISKDFEIGAHTMTHPDLRTLDENEARKEIVTSKTYLENETGKTISSFCYPAGFYSARDVRLVKEAGFTLARTVKRFVTSIGSEPYTLPTTIHAYNHWSDLWNIFCFAGGNPFKFISYLRWDTLAKALFDQVLITGGVFHLWGHSWEIEKHNDWERLEGVLSYIAGHQDVYYLTNSQLI